MSGSTIASNRKSILFIMFLGYTLASMDRFFINYAILPISQDLHLSASSTGLVLSSFFLGYALMQMPGGWLADKFGARYTLVGCIVAWSIFTGMTALAWSLTAILIIRFIFGLGEGGFIPASAKMITDSFPQESRSRSMSILLTAAAFSGVLTPIIATSMMVSTGWRTIFVVFGCLGIIMGFIFWFFLKPRFETNENTETSQIPTEPISTKIPIHLLLKTPMLWSLLVSAFAVYCINWGTASWLPTYLVQVRGLDLKSLGYLQIIPAVSSIFFVLFAGYLVDKVFVNKEKLLGVLCGIGLTLFMYLMFNAPNITMFIIYQSLLPIFTGTGIVLVTTLPMKRLPELVGGSAVGMIQFGGQIAGFVSPIAIGMFVDAFNGAYTGAIGLLIGCGVLFIISILTLSVTKGKIFNFGQNVNTSEQEIQTNIASNE